VFHRDVPLTERAPTAGSPRATRWVIGDFRKEWRKAVVAAKILPMVWLDADGKLIARELIVHDLRRSSLRNLVRSGVRESVAMSITQHKTRDVFDRYNITDGADREDAMAKRSAKFHENAAARQAKNASA
jgi:hypothetical protein